MPSSNEAPRRRPCMAFVRWGLVFLPMASLLSKCQASNAAKPSDGFPANMWDLTKSMHPNTDDAAKARMKAAEEFMKNQLAGWPDHEWPKKAGTDKRRVTAPLRIRGGAPKGKKLDTGEPKVGGGSGANKKSANKKAAEEAEAVDQVPEEEGKTLDELLAEEEEDSQNDRNDFWEWCRLRKMQYAAGEIQVAPELLAKKKNPDDPLPSKGKAPQGFLLQWRNNNRSLNPYSSAGDATALKKTKKK